MKIKINKEQIVYLNSLQRLEAKKEFLLDQFISQCELAIAVEKDNLHKENYGSDRLISMTTKEKPNIECVDLIVKDFNELKNAREDIGLSKENLLKFDLPGQKEKGTVIRVANHNGGISKTTVYGDESLSKEQLKDITKSISFIYEFKGREDTDNKFFEDIERMKNYFDHNLLKEFIEYQPPHPDKFFK